MSRDDKIRLYELLEEYSKEVKSNKKSYDECNTKFELAVAMRQEEHLKMIEEIRNLLCYDF